jgi:arylsulfatase
MGESIMGSPIARFTAVVMLLSGTATALAAQKADPRPNIVLVMADDLGFSDVGCYGSEILTPNLDEMAEEGLQFTQFYNTARCCPTRAALLTGLYPHQAGVGHMMDDRGQPGYRGNLNRQSATIAEVLGAAGYQTYMSGKWHVTRYTDRGGPKHTWPLQRGFEHFYGTIHGGGSYFDPVTLTLDNQFVGITEDYYYTEAISEQAAQYIREASRSERPFFLYVAYTSPHWPLHARDGDIARYRDKYQMGWDELRRRRRERMIELGVIRSRWPLTPRDERVPAWDDAPDKAWQQRRMEVYAAQVDNMDRGIGRIREALAQTGAAQNTLLIFLADNGGCAEEIKPNWKGLHIPEKTHDQRPVIVGNNPNIMPGSEDTYQSYGIPWANVSNTPFRLYKHWVHEGGIAAPLIVCWPGVIRSPGRLTRLPGHVVDIMPTCLEAARTAYPEHLGGYRITPAEGRSLMPILSGETRNRGPIFWEHEGNRAVRDGRWKLVSKFPGTWELYDIEADRTEMNDLAEKDPERVQSMSKLYDEWAKRANVVPWGEL